MSYEVPFVIEVHDMWSLKENPQDRHSCRYIGPDGSTVREIEDAVLFNNPYEAGQAIASHDKFLVGNAALFRTRYQPQTEEQRRWVVGLYGGKQ